MHGILNIVRREVQRMMGIIAQPRAGVVVAYDPTNYCARVKLQPGGQISGWLPVLTLWGGNGWGIFAPPTPGDVVKILFQEGGQEAGIVLGRFYSSVTRPLPAPSGEFWLVHQSGSFLKLHNDGSVEINAKTNLTATVGQNLQATVSGTTTVSSTGNVNVSTQGNATVSATGTATVIGQAGASVTSPQSVTVAGNAGVVINTQGDAQCNIQGNITGTVAGTVSLTATQINLN